MRGGEDCNSAATTIHRQPPCTLLIGLPYHVPESTIKCDEEEGEALTIAKQA